MLKLSVVLVRIRLPSPDATLHRLPFQGSTITPPVVLFRTDTLPFQRQPADTCQRGMELAIGLKGASGRAFPDFANGKTIRPYLGGELLEKSITH